MEELRAADTEHGKAIVVAVENGLAAEQDKSELDSDGNPISAVNRVWGGDKRLSLYGYTLETINMLLLPMMQSKYVLYFSLC